MRIKKNMTALAIAFEIADMVIFYARVRENAEELEKAWES